MLIKLEARIKQGLLCRFRAKRKLTQADAAALAGVSATIWNSIECMRFSNVGWESIKKVADLLDVRVDEICPEEIKDANLQLKREAYREDRCLEMYARATAERLSLPEMTECCTTEEIRSALKSVMQSITYRERTVLELRYGLDGKGTFTLEEIGKMFRITRTRVKQIEERAILKLQHPLRVNKLEELSGGKNLLAESIDK